MQTPGLAEAVALLAGRKTLALTGAGISTESGIPDYRGPDSVKRKINPVQYRDFIESEAARKRYWARSSVGWPKMQRARPNDGHLALAGLEQAGCLIGVLTQNVDGLHIRAGSSRVLELHGTLGEVRCLSCGMLEARGEYQTRMLEVNSHRTGFPSGTIIKDDPAPAAPDGDAVLAEATIDSFAVPSCLGCRGVVKPNIVFFGESVPADVVSEAWKLVGECEVLLVAGSSLAVYSGFRFVRGAASDGKPIVIVNRGPTRGDGLATVRIEGGTGEVLAGIAEQLSGPISTS